MWEEEDFLIIRDLTEVTGIDRILREIERDGTSKKVSRREMGRHVDFVSSNSKCKSIQCREI